ncbi:DUF2127 domain-containing protein [Cupriavidus sp. AU9028]|uniref:DUF2127 domain-containing protein n=1 Tax=Cupriavidus sp. AU9028 TaxID=2871157 RepID=UPI001C93C4DB|nr:DUF2127 domain-containing protein [Cupriavidus sp. AU9028]MBY4898577.1 DUF2127 domain-containing protein [Cupriavidus sp. AU9028]
MARNGAGPVGLRGIALFEAAKGVAVLVAGAGIAAFWHRDAQAFAEAIVARLHLNPGSKVPGIFLSIASNPDDPRLWAIGASALVYVAMRLAEAYGLWHDRTWAQWLGVWSGAIYIPLELYEAAVHPTLLHIGLAIANAAIVAYLAANLARERRGMMRGAARRHE